MEYNFTEIEKKWKAAWQQNQTYKVENDGTKPKYYVLDMFPYPSGSGLHIGHPLGYTASDIFSRYKRMKGFNVLHPMGFDAFGLPAEQYAIENGLHPNTATQKNIDTFKTQLNNLGLSYDWTREVTTCDPNYYKWTQWIFLQMFEHWYNNRTDRAEPIADLITYFEQQGTNGLEAAGNETLHFTAAEWRSKSNKEKTDILMNYRICYSSFADIWYCPALGTVLANDEVKDGLSERGGHPVEKRKMRQWFYRTTAYAERLLRDLDGLAWSDSLKEQQRNWIGRSEGALVDFPFVEHKGALRVFTTRPDTIFGVTFMVVAPEHELVAQITTPAQKEAIDNYVAYVKSRSERDRLADVKTVTGCFTGAYVTNPLNNQPIPVWISEYVLAGYGTGAIMAVPSSDDRDFKFAQKFDLPIICVIEGTEGIENPTEKKRGIAINSDFLNGLETEQAITATIARIKDLGCGEGKINYRLRDAIFSRQRYWGEPFPIVYRQGIAQALPLNDLPLILPEVESYKPTGAGASPLANLADWVNMPDGGERETDTMPGFAGSNWYYLRYMSPQEPNALVSPNAEKYWQNVDFYIGGAEHAVGHLLYSRTCYKFLYDMGLVGQIEPFKRLLNQGMIQGRSNFVYRIKGSNTFVSYGLKEQYETIQMNVLVDLVENDVLNIESFRKWRPDLQDAEFVLEDGQYICGWAIEKMSKTKHNVVNPNDIITKYGADCLRMYIMFLGPLEDSKPWSTDNIKGVSRFLNKFWAMFFDKQGRLALNDEEPALQALKVLHKTIKRITADIERISFNTCVSTFMECINELSAIRCNNRAVLLPLLTLMAPFAPFLAEELWQIAGCMGSVHHQNYPSHEEAYTVEDSFECPVQIGGKVRGNVQVPVEANEQTVRELVLADEGIKKWTDGKEIALFKYVPKRIVSIVVK